MKDKSLLVLVLSSLAAVLLLLVVPDKSQREEIKYQGSLYSSFKKITTTTGGVYKLASEKRYENSTLNLLYYNKETDDYLSFFIDQTSGKITSFDNMLKEEFKNDFYNTENRLLLLKYPKFIVNGIMSDNVKKTYRILDNEIIVYYKNVLTNPEVNEKFYLKINNNEVSKYLNYEHKLDREYHNEDGLEYDPSKKYIAFTFDDGPSKNNTKDIVNYLKDNKAHATFFMLGNSMANNPDIVNYVLEHGNEIGSHTYSHKNLKRISLDEVESEMRLTQEAYNSITNKDIKLLRPPYGAINEKIKETFSYPYILWSVDTLDWRYKNSDYLYNYVINNVNDGDIVLMHDIHDSTKVALEKILPELYAKGYRVVSVSELAKLKGISLEPNKSYRSIK